MERRERPPETRCNARSERDSNRSADGPARLPAPIIDEPQADVLTEPADDAPTAIHQSLASAMASTPARRPALPEKHALAGFEITRVLGHGAFGITYLAHDRNLNRRVAIKEYLPRHLADRDETLTVRPFDASAADEYCEGLSRFIAEARMLGQFEHANIAQIHSVFEENGTAYMVMRYEEGRTLSSILRERGTLSEAETLEILFPLLAGLEAIHQAGILHRDIKPGNIFLRSDGSPILLDFGSARKAAADGPQELTALVTSGYAPIEQYSRESALQGPWTDLYGLGATLYRAVTGYKPPDALQRGAALANGAEDTMRKGSEHTGGRYRRAFLEAIDFALEYKIARRPQSVDEWRRRFSNLAVGGSACSDAIMTTTLDDADVPSKHVVHEGREKRPGVWATAADDTRSPAISTTRVATRRNRMIGRAAAAAIVAAAATCAYVWETEDRLPVAPASPPAALIVDISQKNFAMFLFGDPILAPRITTPATVPSRDVVIVRLLNAAADDIAALRLTTPQAANAYDKYRQVLALDPTNAEARDGIVTLARRYVALSRSRLTQKRIALAERHLRRAEALAPNVEGAAAVRELIHHRKRELAFERAAAARLARADAAREHRDIDRAVSRNTPPVHLGVQFVQRMGGSR